MDMLRKSVIITGAASGIGYATAVKFAEKGYNIAFSYHEQLPIELLAELKKYNVDVFSQQMELKDENSIIKFFTNAFNVLKHVDAVVLNAGKEEKPALLCDKSSQEINDTVNINFVGTILCNKYASEHFLKQKSGAIVNISSIYGVSGGSCESVYSACKAGIVGLTKSLASELAPYIRVNAVAPGCVETKMTKILTQQEKEEIKSTTPLARLGKPEDIANAIFFLASDEASFITGECLNVTGGVIKF